MSTDALCRCGHEKAEHETYGDGKDQNCLVIVDPRDLEEPATYCQCGDYFPVRVSP